jgi:hypothetical protein
MTGYQIPEKSCQYILAVAAFLLGAIELPA